MATIYTIQDQSGDDVDIIANDEEGTIEVEETLGSGNHKEGDLIYSSFTVPQARKFALRLLQAAHEVDPQ